MAAGVVVMVGVLLRWGLRFRRETIPPTCRRCGYDVSRRPPGVERCSECGADLTAPGAIITVRPRANPRVAIPVGLAGFVLGLFLAFSVIRFPWSGWFTANAPIGWIERLAKNHRGADGDVYRAAWHNRGENAAGLFDHLLDLQGDPSVPWTGQWGNVLLFAAQRGQITEAQKVRFVRQFLGDPTIRLRTPLRQGDPLMVDVVAPQRGAMPGNFSMTFRLAAKADGKPMVRDDIYGIYGALTSSHTMAILANDWGPQVTPGPHKMSVTLARQIAGLAIRLEQTKELDVEVLPRGTPIGKAIVDPSKADEAARAVSVAVYHWHDNRAFAEVQLFPADVDRSFTIYAVIDGVEKRIGSVSAFAGGSGTSNTVYVPISVERAKKLEKLTIILVGDGEALAGTLGQTNYWSGRIVYPDVPLGTWTDYQRQARQNSPAPTTSPYRVEDMEGRR
jgi:hypothetical protein